jgi:hypothetical protein
VTFEIQQLDLNVPNILDYGEKQKKNKLLMICYQQISGF